MPATKNTVEKYRVLIEKYNIKHPYLSNNQLAKLVIKEEGLKGSSGHLRHAISMLKSEGKASFEVFSDEEDIIIPESWYQERPHYIIPNAVRKLLVFGDLHIPFHDVNAIKTALRYGEEKGVEGILLNGDITDMFSFSRFIKRPDLRRPKEEVETVKTFLAKIRDKYPTYKLFYKFGNHEDRFNKYIMQNAEALWSLPGMNLRDILELNKLGIEYIDERTVIEFGKLSIIHGHEIWGGGINVARNFRIKARVSLLFNHFHRHQIDVVPTLDGKHQGAWAVGCLCGLRPDYMPVNDWLHGAAIIERDAEGYFTVKNKQIMNGRII